MAACFLSGFVIPDGEAFAQEKLIYHNIKVDSHGNIAPWFKDDDLGLSFDHIINLVWNFWDNIRSDPNGLPYYMSHQVWSPRFNDSRGIGGDQIQMALSSWQLLYAYTGNEKVKENMKFMADYYLSHSLSSPRSKWPDLPFPYNTLIYSGKYDGDMILGRGYLQPDKAGSFALELVHLYKQTIKDYNFYSSAQSYLNSAIRMGEVLAKKLKSGNEKNSPLPFKINALTGELGKFLDPSGTTLEDASYTTNWAPTMELFLELQTLNPAHKSLYKKSFHTLLAWMKKYPLKTNRWGPFFEDVMGYSDTQINAITFARFMMEHTSFFPQWKTEVPLIFDWVYSTLGNEKWKDYGVTVVNEQTSFLVPGESHVARQGATELLYCRTSGDFTRKNHAIRQLIWATYMVDDDGKNRFPGDENWLTDGYGDYLRHYLRAMADFPELAPSKGTHIVSSSSVVQQATYYGADKTPLYYRTFDNKGVEVIRMPQKPSSVLIGGEATSEVQDDQSAGYTWTPLSQGGVLRVNRVKGSEVLIQE